MTDCKDWQCHALHCTNENACILIHARVIDTTFKIKGQLTDRNRQELRFSVRIIGLLPKDADPEKGDGVWVVEWNRLRGNGAILDQL